MERGLGLKEERSGGLVTNDGSESACDTSSHSLLARGDESYSGFAPRGDRTIVGR